MSNAKRYLAVLATVFLTGALLTAGAQADGVKNQIDGENDWHEAIPNIPVPQDPDLNPLQGPGIKAECVVTGTVSLVEPEAKKGHGVGTKPVHGSYAFTSAQIVCESANEHYSGAFDVLAQGGTDGLNDPLGDPKKFNDKKVHGETLSQGWSHSANYGCGDAQNDDPANINKGDISVREQAANPQWALPCKSLFDDEPTEPALGESWVKFVRGWEQAAGENVATEQGELVIAWGFLDWNDPNNKKGGAGDCFRADLTFEPTATGDKDGETVVTEAALEGEAVVYNTGDAVNAKDLRDVPADRCDISNEGNLSKKSSSSSSDSNGGGTSSRGPNG